MKFEDRYNELMTEAVRHRTSWFKRGESPYNALINLIGEKLWDMLMNATKGASESKKEDLRNRKFILRHIKHLDGNEIALLLRIDEANARSYLIDNIRDEKVITPKLAKKVSDHLRDKLVSNRMLRRFYDQELLKNVTSLLHKFNGNMTFVLDHEDRENGRIVLRKRIGNVNKPNMISIMDKLRDNGYAVKLIKGQVIGDGFIIANDDPNIIVQVKDNYEEL